MAPRIRIGIVGLGAAGRAFLPAIRGHAAFELTAIAEPVEATRDEIARETGAKGFSDLPSMLSDAALDAVYIATPTELHPEHAALAFDAKKHVLTEKPMATALDQGLAMIAAAERAGVVLLVGHSHSYDLPIKTMREIVAGGTLGEIVGSFASATIGRTFGIAALLPIAALGLTLAGLLARRVHAALPARVARVRYRRAAARSGSTLAVLGPLWRDSYLFRILAVSALLAGILGPGAPAVGMKLSDVRTPPNTIVAVVIRAGDAQEEGLTEPVTDGGHGGAHAASLASGP